MLSLSVSGGQQWEFMETRANKRGTGSLMVGFNNSEHTYFIRFLPPADLYKNHILSSEFRYGKAPILIATDVASRGLGEYSTT